MIEFKAECGHTVRANDEAAGNVVKCRYCGQSVQVPDNEDSSLDYLFRDVEQTEEEPKKRSWRKKKKGGKPNARGEASRGLDVFGIILRMCYAAFLVAVVIYVGGKWVVPHFRTGDESTLPLERRKRTGSGDLVRRPPPAEAPIQTDGLTTRRTEVGLYIHCTPSTATAYCLEVSRVPTTGRIHDVKGCIESKADGAWVKVPDGSYVVEVALPWNDLSLSDSKLPYYKEYRAFRRKIEFATAEERRVLVNEFFVPDGATSAFVDQSEGRIYIVRTYSDVRVHGGRSRGVRSLFLPRVSADDGVDFSIEPLVEHYIPKTEVYRFNEDHVRNELDYYQVPASDCETILNVLSRIGVAPYMTSDGRTRLFSIGIYDGTFAAPDVGDDTG